MYSWDQPLEIQEMTTTTFKMPKPAIGDVVLFSKDYKNFQNPVVGFVMKEPGDTTISILTFTQAGMAMVQDSVHHLDDPSLHGDHGWQDLGAWKFAEMTNTVRDLQPGPTSGRKTTKHQSS